MFGDTFEAEIGAPALGGPLNMVQMLLFCTLDLERRLPDFDWRPGRPGLAGWHARIAAMPAVAGSLPPPGV